MHSTNTRCAIVNPITPMNNNCKSNNAIGNEKIAKPIKIICMLNILVHQPIDSIFNIVKVWTINI